ncbi:uncharacterized protein LOC123963585 [Micropterus dolomieu]|uniref:uncharacterized protein LOC123963585 n=1 Tax=Micropterus dolomieu TaxID=147949 RepID=UPI001E8D89D8|nr:uncharacterized protein LOC123963585 [Micropterus dolomieu]
MVSCKHGHLESDQMRGKMWIQRDSQCHKALVDIVLDKRWQKDVHNYLRFRSTADLESFQNHILMYASKPYAFQPHSLPSFKSSACCFGLQFPPEPTNNENVGWQRDYFSFKRLYKKNGRRYSIYALKSEKIYGYISELQRRIVKNRLTSGVGMPRRRSLLPDDPRQLGLVPPVPAPATSDLLQRQVRRGLGLLFQPASDVEGSS